MTWPTSWPPWATLTASAALGFGLCALADHAHRRWRGFLPEDVPTGGRKLHDAPTPQAGFLLGALGALLSLTALDVGLAAALALLTGVGYLDDRSKTGGGVTWKLKAIAQLTAAALVVGGTLPTDDPWRWLAALAFTFCVTNAVNFLDNMNGVAASLGGLGVIAAGWSQPHLLCAGALFLGFLPCNWPRARLFLGDGGALPLGGLLAASALQASTASAAHPSERVDLCALLAPTAVPLLDFVQVIAARLWLGYAPWIGDRRHVTHIATYAGMRKTAVAPTLLVIAGLLWVALRSGVAG